jgi:hypothetical protein
VRERPRRWPKVLAWGLWVLAMLALAAAAWLDHLLRQAGEPDLVVLTRDALYPASVHVTATTVGLVVASRRPRHPVGWLLLAIGLTLNASMAAFGYAGLGLLARSGSLPGASYALLYQPAVVVTVLVLVAFLLLLTPTGSLPSPRWRWWARVTAITPISVLLVTTAMPEPSGQTYRLDQLHPMEVLDGFDGALLAVSETHLVLGVAAVVAGAASLVMRFRRATGVERQQLRWVALAAAVVSLLVLGGLVLPDPNWAIVPITASPGVLAAAIGAAVLRYRLYDLDRIVSRTLAYGLLTVLLGAGYAVVVLGLGQVLGSGRDNPSLAVAGATLAVAAVFQPARRRIQDLVDRRFNRRRYDAERTIAAFAGRLRQQTDLDALTAELLSVVDQTMQPTRAALWLRPAAESGRGGAHAQG